MTSVRRYPDPWTRGFHPVYAAEKAALPFGEEFYDLSGAVEYGVDLLSSDWWKAKYPHIKWIWICESNNQKFAWAWNREVHLPQFAMNESYFLHEITHIGTGDEDGELHHGPYFRKNFCELLDERMGEWVGNNLRYWYERYGVPVADV